MNEDTQNFAIPTSIFIRKLSSCNPPFHAKGKHSQNYIIDQSRIPISNINFKKFSRPSTFQDWKTSILNPKYVPVDDLKTSRLIRGHHMPNFEILDAKITSILEKIL